VISCECSESDDDVSKMVWRRKAVWKSGAGTWCHCNKMSACGNSSGSGWRIDLQTESVRYESGRWLSMKGAE
jgi:hypothetical protein